ncbi:MAG: adenosylcobinamide-phosphate synthase CbiB [Egibacteraceae bacterium]
MTAAALAPLGGWLVDLAGGDPRRGHPVALYGELADRLEQRIWRDRRSAGVAYATALVAAPTLLTAAAQQHLSPRSRTLLLVAVTWAALGGRSLTREATAVGNAVAAGDLDTARRRLPALVGRDPTGLGGPELCRAAVESVAENTADAVVAPLVYAALAGPAGVVAHRCANTLDAMVGHRCARYGRFGWAAARLDDVLGWLPARATALLAAACAPAVGGQPRRALAVCRRDGRAHPSPNAGRCEAAFAGALGVRLGGTNHYSDHVEVRGPHGDGPAPDPADVGRAVTLSRLVGLAGALLAAGLIAARGHAV